MGEYAYYRGDDVKIGTCESMYYLRADQAHLVRARSGSVDPIKDAERIRFRFPFPDEDGLEPGIVGAGAFERGVGLPLLEVPEEASRHYSVQFSSDSGYSVSLPCPEGPESLEGEGYRIHRNGVGPRVAIKQQKVIGDDLIPVCACTGCGSLFRLEDPDYFAPVLALLEEWEEWQREKDAETEGYQVRQPGPLYGVNRELMARIMDGYNGGWAKLRAGEGVSA